MEKAESRINRATQTLSDLIPSALELEQLNIAYRLSFSHVNPSLC